MNKNVERLVIGLGGLYVLVLGWAMVNTSYDVWGAFLLLPPIALVSVAILRRVFADESSGLFKVAAIGLGAKFVGTVFRYWVTYSSYGGASDAEGYHIAARSLAAAIRSGAVSPTSIIPRGTNTAFIRSLTTTIYTVVGSSRFAGFIVFGWMAYWGSVLFLRAAMVAIPGLAAKRYAYLVFLTPSLLYWPSSIGKEAWIFLNLGIATYGVARVLAGRWGLSSVVLIVAGLAGAGVVRPHFAAIWTGALVIALFAGLFARRTERSGRRRLVTLGFLVVAVVGLYAVGGATLRFLNQSTSGDATSAITTQVSALFATTNFRTSEGGSSFQTIAITGPQDWPYAIVRTLTRPLLYEARSVAELIPAVEMTMLLALGVFSWRRLFNAFHMARSTPYLIFAAVVLCVFGLAFASFGNLGILTRQRSLVMPLFLLPWALPPWYAKRAERPDVDAGMAHDRRTASDTSSMAR